MDTLESPSTSKLPSKMEPAILAKTVAAKKTVISIFICLIIIISWLGFLDTKSGEYISDSLKQALVTYGVARGVNAIVSILQTIQFVGLGFGEVLDPINDLVERFSSVMELAIASLFIQKILLEITSSQFIKFALTVSGGLLIISLYVRTGISTLMISRVFITLLFLRFCIAIVVLLNGIVSAAFVTDRIEADIEAVKQVEKSAPTPQPTAEDVAVEPTQPAQNPREGVIAEGGESPQAMDPEKNKLLGRVIGMGTKLKDIGEKAASVVMEKFKKWNPNAMKEKIEQVVPQMLNLMALFLLKTLILPLVFLYGLKFALAQIWNIRPIPLYTGKPILLL